MTAGSGEPGQDSRELLWALEPGFQSGAAKGEKREFVTKYTSI
jgi:hypothetical protein